MPDPRSLFGSVARTRVLGVLAGYSEPISGYRVAAEARLERTRTYGELRRLASIGIVASTPTARGRTGWVLIDPSVRQFCRRRIRIQSVDELLRQKDARLPAARRRVRALPSIDLSLYPARPDRVPNRLEFRRSARKDILLRNLRFGSSSRDLLHRSSKRSSR